MIARFLRLKFKNVATAFDPLQHTAALEGYSYAEIERICTQAVKTMIVDRRQAGARRATSIAPWSTRRGAAQDNRVSRPTS